MVAAVQSDESTQAKIDRLVQEYKELRLSLRSIPNRRTTRRHNATFAQQLEILMELEELGAHEQIHELLSWVPE